MSNDRGSLAAGHNIFLAPHVTSLRQGSATGSWCLRSGASIVETKGQREAGLIEELKSEAGVEPRRFREAWVESPGLVTALLTGSFLTFSPENISAGLPEERQFGYLSTKTMRPADSQRRINRSEVLILGVGGIGGGILQHLVGAGVRRFVLVDDDVVAPSNLNRQFLYSRTQVAEPKVAAAEAYIRDRVDEPSVRSARAAIRTEVDLDKLIEAETTLVIQGADSDTAALDEIAARVCMSRQVALLTGAASEWGGYVGPLVVPADRAAFERICQARATSDAARLRFPGLQAPWYSYGPFNSLVAAQMAHMAVTYLAGLPLPGGFASRIFLDATRFTTTDLWSTKAEETHGYGH